MQNVLITGAAGDIGSRLRKLLRGVYPHIRASDIRKPADLAPGDDFVAADLTDLAQVEKAVAGIVLRDLRDGMRGHGRWAMGNHMRRGPGGPDAPGAEQPAR